MKKRALSGILLVMGAVILAGCGRGATVPGGRAADRQNNSHKVGSHSTALAASTRSAGSPEHRKPASGQAAIADALGIVARTTTVPLWGPQARAIHAPDLRGHHVLSAETMSTRNQYAVSFIATVKPYPVNSALLKLPPNTGLAQLVGDFSGQRYRSVVAAQGALTDVHPPASPPHRMEITPTIQADEWTQAGLVVWHQDGWLVEMNGLAASSVTQRIYAQIAQKMVHRLSHTALPAKHGIIIVDVAGDGEHTLVSWRLGRLVYRTFSEFLPSTAIGMAASMRPSPTLHR